jgi:hypothetical protein
MALAGAQWRRSKVEKRVIHGTDRSSKEVKAAGQAARTRRRVWLTGEKPTPRSEKTVGGRTAQCRITILASLQSFWKACITIASRDGFSSSCCASLIVLDDMLPRFRRVFPKITRFSYEHRASNCGQFTCEYRHKLAVATAATGSVGGRVNHSRSAAGVH